MDTTILQQKQNKKNVWILLFGTTGKLKKNANSTKFVHLDLIWTMNPIIWSDLHNKSQNLT